MGVEENTYYFLVLGIGLGLSAGVSPGPLLTLVISQTLKHNKREGIKVALSPLITDVPIILISLLVYNKLTRFNSILGLISFLGGLFMLYLAYESFKIKAFNPSIDTAESDSLKKGIIANFLNASPYVFWASVGAPIVFKALNQGVINVLVFLGSFYLCLIGSKLIIALVVDRSKQFINQSLYVNLMRFLGLVLLIFAMLFFYDGYRYL